MAMHSPIRVVLANAPHGLQRLVLVFSGPQKLQKTVETSPAAVPAEVAFELPNGLYAVVAWYSLGGQTYLLDRPLPLELPGQAALVVDLAASHPDTVEGSNL